MLFHKVVQHMQKYRGFWLTMYIFIFTPFQRYSDVSHYLFDVYPNPVFP